MLKFLVAVLIDQVSIDSLVYYGAGLTVVSIVIFLMYSITAHKNYSECRYTKVADKTIYPQLASFSGWTMYSALAGVVTTQGNTILLNVFFGPLTTAAFAISLQISHAFQALSNSIVLAFRPAMIILYAEKNYGGLNWLFDASNKFLVYLLLSVSVPIVCEIRTIFNWWLGPVSEETILFARLFIIYIILMVMHNPITTIVQATGKIKKYTFYVESIMLLCLVFAFVAFKMGWSSYYAIVSLIVVSAIAHIVRLVMLHQLYPSFHVSHYMRSIALPAVAITIITIGIILTAHMYTDNAIVRFLAVFFLSAVVTLGLAYAIGINKTEKRQVRQFVQQFINRRRI
jgi:O-antigen/teichoic acid export membrane protein